MRKTALILFAALLVCGLLTTSATARPAERDPEALAKAAAAYIARMSEHGQQANARTAVNTIEAIERLLEAGKPEAAVVVARKAIRLINNRTERMASQMRHRCMVTERVLHRLGADDLADRLRAFCRDQIEDLLASRARAVAAIRDALPERPTEDPAD